jgi:hypothetical protein
LEGDRAQVLPEEQILLLLEDDSYVDVLGSWYKIVNLEGDGAQVPYVN